MARKEVRSILLLTLISFVAMTSLPSRAFALFEIRGGYSQASVLPDEINAASPSHPELENLFGLTVDFILCADFMPVDFGARFEVFSERKESGYNEIEAAWNRVSFLIARRLWYDAFYIGPLAAIGVSNDFKYSVITATQRDDYRSTDNISASIAIDSGFKFSVFTFGGELGYTFAPLGELKTASGTPLRLTDSTPIKIDLTGSYVRVTAGFAY